MLLSLLCVSSVKMQTQLVLSVSVLAWIPVNSLTSTSVHSKEEIQEQ